MTNEVIENIINRRSCKKYKSDPVPQELIDIIVEAGLTAPSGMNRQAGIALVVTDKETRDKLSALNAKYDPKKRVDPFYNAPVVIPVLGDTNVFTYIYDGSCMLENMMLAASSLGLGNCWIHRAKEVFEDEEGRAILRELGIPDEYEGIGNLILGYAAVENTAVPERRPGRLFKK
ncbi:MAG: nitroreductase [Lachnospiraceae bacterium]|nr:nitroreductase [Lachnospiraceae bacterium]